jgi:nucleoside-diphosphate-sugar epimerase
MGSPPPEPLSGRRVLVTGGQGFIGRHLVRALTDAGAHPVVVHHPDTPAMAGLYGDVLALNLDDRTAVADALAGVDMVAHLAARAGGIQFQEDGAAEVFAQNRRMTDHVLEACALHGVRRVFLASSLVVYRASDRPFGETHPVLGPGDRPSPYAWSKITDEVVAGWFEATDVIIGRFGNVYGPGASFDPGRSTVVHALIDRAARLPDGDELLVWGDGSAVRSFVFVEDVARAAVALLERGEVGAYNVDSGRPVTIAELAATVRDAVNPSLGLAFDASRPAGAPFRVPLIDKLSGLGYQPEVDLEEGVRRTVAWYRSWNGSA